MAVNSAPPSEELFVTGLPMDSTSEMAKQIFSQYGSVKETTVLPVSPGKQAAAGFVVMNSVEDARWIVEHVNGNVPQGLANPVTVVFATPKSMRPGGGGKGAAMKGMMKGMKGSGMPPDMMQMMQMFMSAMGGMGGMGGGKGGGWGKGGGARPPTGSVIRLQGLPFSASNDEIQQFFAGYGLTGRMHIQADAGGRPTGIGFVEFVSPEEAKRAYNEKNYQTIGTRYIELMEAYDKDIEMYLNGGAAVMNGGARAY
mmetsp:Transcript_28042/g.65858  ORF Transcript_28042/g.65858 Transcript_28042/m.65858 type:complete len:255 (+) Transcript_28042:57-821(+)